MDKSEQSLINYFYKLGIYPGQHLLVHAGFSRIKRTYSQITPQKVNSILMDIVGSSGSIIYPTFSYCFKNTTGSQIAFDPDQTSAKTGVLSQTFWQQEEVIRTLSPTHSFGVWGQIAEDRKWFSSPDSPLGTESILAWMKTQYHAHVLFLNTDFKALSLGHYLEIISKLPWANVFPWQHMGVEPVGVSLDRDQPLHEVPGCSQGFLSFQKVLEDNSTLNWVEKGEMKSVIIPVFNLVEQGLAYFKSHSELLLCPMGKCQACDERRIRCQLH